MTKSAMCQNLRENKKLNIFPRGKAAIYLSVYCESGEKGCSIKIHICKSMGVRRGWCVTLSC